MLQSIEAVFADYRSVQVDTSKLTARADAGRIACSTGRATSTSSAG
jgi:hypothetical protein